MTKDEAQQQVQHLRDHAVDLSAWEVEFLQSLSEKLEQYGNDPSDKQTAIIDKISRERLP